MSFIGNTPTTQSFISGTETFNGTGAQTAYTLTRSVASVNDIQITINNVVQQPNVAYTVLGNVVTFTSAPSAGTGNIYVRYLSTTAQSITPSQGTVQYSSLNADNQSKLGIGFKNRIINGAMVIDQRNAGASVTQNTGDLYPIDRFRIGGSVTSKFTAQQNAGSVTPPNGFVNYVGITSSSAYSVGASDYFFIDQAIEGYNTADLNWGTANAKTVTLSFWVRSSLTGTFGGSLKNNTGTQSFPFAYIISSANTWEQKSITITGSTTGTWLTTNGVGIRVIFGLGVGATYSGTAGVWGGANCLSVTGATSVVGTSGATFYITGVQLEVGTQATTFDYRSYGTELALCQRYCYIPANKTAGYFSMGWTYNTGTVYATVPLQVTMRAAPTLTATTGTNIYQFVGNNTGDNFNSFTLGSATTTCANMYNNTEISGAAGIGGGMYADATAQIIFSAEL